MPERILLLSYAFPPMWAPEAMLSAKRMGALPSFEVDVLTSDPPGDWQGQNQALDEYVRDRFGRVERVRRRAAWDRVRLGPAAGAIRQPDEFRLLNGPMRRAAERAVGKRDYAAIVSWSQWHSIHLVAKGLAKRHEIPWIAHLSDPWLRNPFVSRTPMAERLNARMERSVFERADRILFTSDETVELCMPGYPPEWRDKVRVLPHAFDPELFAVREPAPSAHDRAIVLRYLGAFYGPRSPAPLIAALGRLDPDLVGRLRVEIVGRVEPGMLDTAEARALPEGTIVWREPVDYLDSLAEMAAADGLLVVDAPADSSPFLPSKLVDYVGAGRPIAALTPPGAAAELTRRLGGPVADPSDVEACARALRELVGLIEAAGDAPFGDPDVRAEYDMNRVGERMASVVRELVAARV